MQSVAQIASEIRTRWKTERLNGEQLGYELGLSRKTAIKEVSHLPYYRTKNGDKRWKVTDIAEHIYCNTERSSG